MKKISLLLLLLPFTLCSCDNDESRVETWTVAPEKGVAGISMGFGHVPAYIVKKGDASNWEIFSNPIEGFSLQKGYESVLRVRIDHIANPPADGADHRYIMEERISHVPAAMPVDPLVFSPEFEVVVASERAAEETFWIRDTRADKALWEVFPWKIEDFDYTPGYEYRLRIQPVAEYTGEHNDLTDQDSWTVKYLLKELISSEQKESEGLPEQAPAAREED